MLAICYSRSSYFDSKYDTKREISAISFMPLDSQKPFASTVSVAYWESNIVEIFSIVGTTLKSKSKSPKLHAVVRSLLLYNFGTSTSSKDPNYHAYLLAGLGDGSVATLSWKGNTLHDLTTISLGRTPVNLTPCEVDGKRAVFAAGNRANVFFCEKNRLANSPIMLKVLFVRIKYMQYDTYHFVHINRTFWQCQS